MLLANLTVVNALAAELGQAKSLIEALGDPEMKLRLDTFKSSRFADQRIEVVEPLRSVIIKVLQDEARRIEDILYQEHGVVARLPVFSPPSSGYPDSMTSGIPAKPDSVADAPFVNFTPVYMPHPALSEPFVPVFNVQESAPGATNNDWKDK